MLLTFLALGVFIVLVCTRRLRLEHKDEGYRYLSSVNNPAQGGYYAEYNYECGDDARNQCVMENGQSGNCVLNSMCMTNMSEDMRKNDIEVPKPRCIRPTFKQNCNQFCACLGLQNRDYPGCIDDCKSWFSNA
jgi:hypothetical protein